MDDNDKQIVKVATNFVFAILNYGEQTSEAVLNIYEINNGNKKLLVKHLRAINSIVEKATGILGGNENENK